MRDTIYATLFVVGWLVNALLTPAVFVAGCAQWLAKACVPTWKPFLTIE